MKHAGSLAACALLGILAVQCAGPVQPAYASEDAETIRRLAAVAEIWVFVTAQCPPCAKQVAFARQVGAQFGYRMAIIRLDGPETTPMPQPMRSLLRTMQPTLAAKIPVVVVAVPQLPAILPLVSSLSLPANTDELISRLALVADLVQTSAGGASP